MDRVVGRFRLADEQGAGIWCDEHGLWVGEVSLLERASNSRDLGRWRPRPTHELNLELSERYGLPIEFHSKVAGLEAVGRALDRDDLGGAQIAALHLRMPDPPRLAKSAPTVEEIINLARHLRASGLLKADWDPAKHPRWPAKSPGGVGGEFAPGDSGASLTPAQLAIPLPYELPVPGAIPLPSEVLPPSIVIPNAIPRDLPTNPFPDRAECAEEWESAKKYCSDLQRRKLLGKGAYRGMGMTFEQCVRGQVSEGCGGNSLEA